MMLSLFQDSRYSDIKYFFIFPSYVMRLAGYWPGDPICQRKVVLCVLGVFLVQFFCIFELNFVFHNSDDLARMLDVLAGTTTRVVTAFKLLIVMYHRENIAKMLKTLRKYFKDGNFFLLVY